jgi:hypothetical protein
MMIICLVKFGQLLVPTGLEFAAARFVVARWSRLRCHGCVVSRASRQTSYAVTLTSLPDNVRRQLSVEMRNWAIVESHGVSRSFFE